MTWEPAWEAEELKDKLPSLLEYIQDFETRVDEPDLFLLTADQTLDNLERQGLNMSNKAHFWIQSLPVDTDLWNKVTFDVHPNCPKEDIQPTGSCEFWIRNADLVRHKPKPTSTTEQPPLNTYPEKHRHHVQGDTLKFFLVLPVTLNTTSSFSK